MALFLLPRLRSANDSARAATEAERAANAELNAAVALHSSELEAARAVADERESAHERQFAALHAATEEKIALVAGSREQLSEQMKAIASDTLRDVSEQIGKLAAAQREADRATAAGELGLRTEEIKRTLDPIAENLRRVSQEVGGWSRTGGRRMDRCGRCSSR